MSNVHLRPAIEADFAAIYKIVCELAEVQLNKDNFTAIFLDNLQAKNVHYIVAVVETKVVGFVSLHIQAILHQASKVAEIKELFVDPNQRGQGIGSKLIEQAKQIAAENNCPTFEVSCSLKREKAHQLYQKEGLQKTHYKFTSSTTG